MNSNVVANHIPRSIVPTFGVTRLLTFAKPFGSIWPIMVGEVLYWWANDFINLVWQSKVGAKRWFMVTKFKHLCWLGGVGGGHCKCFQQHFLNSRLSRVNSHDKKPMVLTFPFCFIFLCLASSLQFQPPFLFGRVICHSFFVGHGDSLG